LPPPFGGSTGSSPKGARLGRPEVPPLGKVCCRCAARWAKGPQPSVRAKRAKCSAFDESGRRGSNPRPLAWEAAWGETRPNQGGQGWPGNADAMRDCAPPGPAAIPSVDPRRSGRSCVFLRRVVHSGDEVPITDLSLSASSTPAVTLEQSHTCTGPRCRWPSSSSSAMTNPPPCLL
jgi:hypothetical protein